MCETVMDPTGGGCDGPASHETEAKWKEVVEKNVKLWIEEIPSCEEITQDEDSGPDLYSFYEELCVLRSEVRKSARRSHETLSRFGDTISDFGQFMKTLYGKISALEGEKEAEEILAKKDLYLPLVELLDRFKRLELKLNDPPNPGFFSGRGAWKDAWRSLRSAFAIVCSHFEELLNREGIVAVDAINQAFDPRVMTAVAVQERNDLEPNTVLEEISRGYLYHGHVLKLAEVKVAKGEKA